MGDDDTVVSDAVALDSEPDPPRSMTHDKLRIAF
jgi:hypothetical protein